MKWNNRYDECERQKSTAHPLNCTRRRTTIECQHAAPDLQTPPFPPLTHQFTSTTSRLFLAPLPVSHSINQSRSQAHRVHFRARCFFLCLLSVMSYQYQQPTGESQQSQAQSQGQQQQQAQPAQQQSASAHESQPTDSPAPAFNQQGSGGSQNGSESMGEKTTLW